MVQQIIDKFADWLKGQQSTVVVLVLILIAILYGMNRHLPAVLEYIDRQLTIQREYDKEQRLLDRSSNERIHQQKDEANRDMLQRVLEFRRVNGAVLHPQLGDPS